MSNPHIENAIHTIGEANNPNSVWESSDAERIALQIEANTRAALGLAYAQDTANLIASREFISIHDSEIAERLARPAPEPPKPAPIEHYRVGPARCNCGFDAYKINAIMVDYSEEFAHHLRSNR